MPDLVKFKVLSIWFHSSGCEVDTEQRLGGYVDFFLKLFVSFISKGDLVQKFY